MGNVIEAIKPDIIAVGHDQADIEAQARKAVEEKGLDIKVVRIGRFGKPELNSSLKIKRKKCKDDIRCILNGIIARVRLYATNKDYIIKRNNKAGKNSLRVILTTLDHFNRLYLSL
jgi:hypothetical protein